MNKIFLAVALIISGSIAKAQNWQTVLPGKANYFTAGQHRSYKGFYYYPPLNEILVKVDSPMLRVIFVESTFQNGPDSVFQFYTSFRDANDTIRNTSCADTSGPSWLGPQLVRKPEGTELYFNNQKDTITIRTQAGPGETWMLAVDTDGRQFVGTVVQSGSMIVDGVADSFKTVSIQAYNGSAPIPHPYNNKVLQWSKAHGWLKTLDFYRFPNTFWGDKSGVAIDSTQHIRLPATLWEGRMTQNIQWKYQPGNEWIWKYEREFSNKFDRHPTNTIVRHDSVLAFQMIATGTGLATIRTEEYYGYHIFVTGNQSYIDSFSNRSYTHTDTVHDVFSTSVPVNMEYPWHNSVKNRCYVWQYDTARYFLTQAGLGPYDVIYYRGCMRLMETLDAPDDYAYFTTWLADFGQAAYFKQNVTYTTGWSFVEEYGRYIFIKTGSDHFGSKINVSKLAVEAAPGATLIAIAPNPSNEKIVVTTNGTQILQVRLMDVSGRVLRQIGFQQRNLIISTNDIPTGIYLLEIAGSGVRQTTKVLIQH
jgi:hypothetical protein